MDYSDFVYISRDDSLNPRRLLNEKYLINNLQPIGFRTYILSDLSITDQIAIFSQAKIIVGVHGAGFTNLVFASKGTVVYELFSDQYKPDMYKIISDQIGLEYHQVICKSDEKSDNPQRVNCQIPSNCVFEILKRAKEIASTLYKYNVRIYDDVL